MIYQTLSNYICKEVYQREPFPKALNLDDLVDAIGALDSKEKAKEREGQ